MSANGPSSAGDLDKSDDHKGFGNAAAALIDSYTNKLNSVDTSGVVRQALVMGLATALFLGIHFLLLRPINKDFLAPRAELAERLDEKIADAKWEDYAAKQKWDDTERSKKIKERNQVKADNRITKQSSWTAKVRDGFLEAYKAIMQDSEQHLVQSGLDSLAYLNLLWLNLVCFASISCTTTILLTFVDWKAHNKGKLWQHVVLAKVSLRDFTITGIEGNFLYFHVGAAYFITAIVCFFIHRYSVQLEKHRVDFYCNPAFVNRKQDAYKRCVLIADIQDADMDKSSYIISRLEKDVDGNMRPVKGPMPRSKVEHVVKRKIFDTYALHDKTHALKTFEVKDPVGKQARMKARNDLVMQLQLVLDEYLTLWLRAKQGKGIKAPPLPRIHPPGQWKGRKVDALRYIKEAFLELEKKYPVDESQKVRYAVVAFSCAGNCSLFLQHCTSTSGKVRLEKWELDFAPTLSGIIWKNIGMLHGTRATSYVVGYIACAILVACYTVLLAPVALLSNAGALTGFYPWLKDWSEANPALFVTITATGPPAISAVLFSIMPSLIEVVAKYQGAKTFHSLQHRTIHWFIAFLVLSQLVMLPCLSTLFTLWFGDLKNRPRQANANWMLKIWIDAVFFFAQVPTTYLSQANYWLNWLTLRWLTNTIQLSQIWWLLKRWITVAYLKMTAQDHAKEAAPAEYTLRIPNSMFSTILGLLYAPLVPFVAPFLTVGLVLQYCYHKLQAKVLFVTVAETGARFWLPEMDRILLFLLVSHAFLALTCALQMADGKIALMLAPAGLAVICFRFFLRSTFDDTLLHMLHDNARWKTAHHDLTDTDLKDVFSFVAKGVKLELGKHLSKSEREAIQERGRELLEKYGLLALLDINDSWMEEHNFKPKERQAQITLRERKATAEASNRKGSLADGKESSLNGGSGAASTNAEVSSIGGKSSSSNGKASKASLKKVKKGASSSSNVKDKATSRKGKPPAPLT